MATATTLPPRPARPAASSSATAIGAEQRTGDRGQRQVAADSRPRPRSRFSARKATSRSPGQPVEQRLPHPERILLDEQVGHPLEAEPGALQQQAQPGRGEMGPVTGHVLVEPPIATDPGLQARQVRDRRARRGRPGAARCRFARQPPPDRPDARARARRSPRRGCRAPGPAPPPCARSTGAARARAIRTPPSEGSIPRASRPAARSRETKRPSPAPTSSTRAPGGRPRTKRSLSRSTRARMRLEDTVEGRTRGRVGPGLIQAGRRDGSRGQLCPCRAAGGAARKRILPAARELGVRRRRRPPGQQLAPARGTTPAQGVSARKRSKRVPRSSSESSSQFSIVSRSRRVRSLR